MRKPRPQGPLNTLLPDRRAVLHEWLAQPLTLTEIRRRCLAEWGITTSETALGAYYKRLGAGLIARQNIVQTDVEAAGIEITIRAGQSGTFTVSIRPLPPQGEPAAQPEDRS